jgi:hypothetical protein
MVIGSRHIVTSTWLCGKCCSAGIAWLSCTHCFHLECITGKCFRSVFCAAQYAITPSRVPYAFKHAWEAQELCQLSFHSWLCTACALQHLKLTSCQLEGNPHAQCADPAIKGAASGSSCPGADTSTFTGCTMAVHIVLMPAGTTGTALHGCMK